MKLNGKSIDKPKDVIVVIPRDAQDHVFTATAVLDFDEFEKICPEPVPPTKTNVKTSQSFADVNNPKYKKKVDEHATMRMNYMIIKSLSATAGLEWEDVDISKPDTYEKYLPELQEGGLSLIEVNKLIEAVMEVNSLRQEVYEEAKKRFLAGQSKKA